MIYITAASLLAAIIAVTALITTQHSCRKSLECISAMLDAAIAGNFSESDFDESLQSAAESRMAQYLAAAAMSSRNLSVERDKLKALIGDISHQTKTPIANLTLYAQLLEEERLTPRAEELCAALTSQCDKLRFLIEALVKLSRLESGVIALHPAPRPAAKLLAAAAAQAAPAAREKDITITLTPCPAGLQAVLDEKWTAEALQNLVDNAVKYTPAGGSIALSATGYELFCRFDVADTGIGIAEEEQAKIFGRFHRAPGTEQVQGLGLGLYLAREIAAGQGGYLKLSSQVGSGSKFSLFLPRAADKN